MTNYTWLGIAGLFSWIMYECLNAGNWMGAFFLCPVAIWLCVNKYIKSFKGSYE